MSGGVDSSVCAAMLKRDGYDCIGMHLEFWTDPRINQDGSDSETAAQNKCCTLQGLEDARYVAGQLDIPFYVMNVVPEFKEKVVDYFLDTYAAGKTPNPCVQCNKNIKFGQLLERARELKADFLATGHYARVVAPKGENTHYELHMARDKSKDQSYFLYHLNQEKLSHVLFPLGDRLKSEVYELAREFGLFRVAEKKESQGLCFFAESKPMYFLRRYLPKRFFEPGPIVTKDGREVGTHRGLPFYTIGQRSGLGIGGIADEPEGAPWYVVNIDVEGNRLIVGRADEGGDFAFVCGDIEFVSGNFPEGEILIEVRIRHRAAPVEAKLRMQGGNAVITSLRPLRGVAPGQAAVFYKGEKLLGGGTILESISHYEKKEGSQKERTDVSIAY